MERGRGRAAGDFAVGMVAHTIGMFLSGQAGRGRGRSAEMKPSFHRAKRQAKRIQS